MANPRYGNPGVWGTAGKAPAKKPKQPKKPARKPVGMSPQAWANKMADEMMQAQINAINEQRATYLAEQSRQRDQAMGRANALNAGLQSLNMPAAISGAFGGARNQVEGLAGGLSNTMNLEADAEAANDNRLLSGTGSEARNEGDTMASVFSHAYGTVPGSALDTIGKAYAKHTGALPGFQLEEDTWAANKDYSSDTSDFDKAISELKAGRPEMVMELMQDRLKYLMDVQKWKWAQQDRRMDMQDRKYKRKVDAYERAQDRLDDKRDWYLAQAKLAMSQGNYERANAYYALSVQRENRYAQSSARTAARLENKDRGLDINGNLLPGFKVGKNGKVVKVKSPSSSDGPDWGDIQHDISNDTDDLTKEIDDPNAIVPGQKVKVNMGYDEAFRILFGRYSGMVKDKVRLKKMIKKVLASKGIKPKKSSIGWEGTYDHPR